MSDPHAIPDVAPKDQEDPDAGSTWTWFLAGSVIVVAIAVGVAALYYDVAGRRISEIRVEAPVSSIDALKASQDERLTSPARRELRADSPDGAIVIPIADAMELVLSEEAGS